jgi:hypothetical protein
MALEKDSIRSFARGSHAIQDPYPDNSEYPGCGSHQIGRAHGETEKSMAVTFSRATTMGFISTDQC